MTLAQSCPNLIVNTKNVGNSNQCGIHSLISNKDNISSISSYAHNSEGTKSKPNDIRNYCALSQTNTKTVSNSTLKNLSLFKRKKSSSNITSFDNSQSEGIKNESFDYIPNKDNGSMLSNPFLQKKYNDIASKSTSMTENVHMLVRRSSLNSIDTDSKVTSRPNALKKCISVTTLKESLRSINDIEQRPSDDRQNKILKRVSFTNLNIREYELKVSLMSND